MLLATRLKITKLTAFRCFGDPAHPVCGRTLYPHSHPENGGGCIHTCGCIHTYSQGVFGRVIAKVSNAQKIAAFTLEQRHGNLR